MGRMTQEGLGNLLEQIVDAVDSTDDWDLKFELIKTILEDDGIVEVED